jgi:S-adenosylmethionine-diacylglycerol 3-amino-3-carboxypropyl transferase
MSNKLTEQVSFDFIRYSNCWEDADVLLCGLNPHPGSKILSIGSAGDNSFSLLTTNPEIVVAVDINKTQLYLIELKKAAIQQLSYDEVLSFLGFRPFAYRDKVFHEIKKILSRDAKIYWENNIEKIKKGVISQGKFEQYFQLFSNKILPLIHSRKTIEELLSYKKNEEQEHFYHSKWNIWRWRLLFKIFFSKYVMGKYGRDPEFLKEVKVPVGEYIYMKAARHLQQSDCQNNFILRYSLTGSFGKLLPHYLLPNNFEEIKLNINKLQIVEGYAEEAINKYGKFHYMNLSNIFEYMDNEIFCRTAKAIVEATEKGGAIAYWNLMVPRRISEILPDKAEHQNELSLNLTVLDKGFFYSRFIVDRVK